MVYDSMIDKAIMPGFHHSVAVLPLPFCRCRCAVPLCRSAVPLYRCRSSVRFTVDQPRVDPPHVRPKDGRSAPTPKWNQTPKGSTNTKQTTK